MSGTSKAAGFWQANLRDYGLLVSLLLVVYH
jgi:hypothetical protein